MSKDYIFHLYWEDRFKNPYRVGILAQIDDLYYFIIKGEKRAEVAHKNGFRGIPGFKEDEVYRSQELFDFFKSRIIETYKKNPCEELAKTGATSMTDSFYVEEASERMVPKYKQIILKTYELQSKLKEEKNKNGDNELPDIE